MSGDTGDPIPEINEPIEKLCSVMEDAIRCVLNNYGPNSPMYIQTADASLNNCDKDKYCPNELSGGTGDSVSIP